MTGLGGLYLKGLIHGGAFFRNFTKTMSSIPHLPPPPPSSPSGRESSPSPCFPQHISHVGQVTSGEIDDMCIRMSWSTCDMRQVLHDKYVGVDES